MNIHIYTHTYSDISDSILGNMKSLLLSVYVCTLSYWCMQCCNLSECVLVVRLLSFRRKWNWRNYVRALELGNNLLRCRMWTFDCMQGFWMKASLTCCSWVGLEINWVCVVWKVESNLVKAQRRKEWVQIQVEVYRCRISDCKVDVNKNVIANWMFLNVDIFAKETTETT